MIEEVKIIRNMSSRTENILQLAEEANELAVEALRLYNAKLHHHVYTDDHFIEEIADVKISIDIVGDYLNNIETYKLGFEDTYLLQLLAKFCCELSKAAIKYRRTLEPTATPTSVSEKEAELNLIHYIHEVKSMIDSIGDYWDSDKVEKIYKEKAIRGVNRYTK